MELARRRAGVSPLARTLPPLLFFTDPERTPHPWRVAERLPEGSAVVYRAFSRSDAIEVGRRLRAACNLSGSRLLVGRDEVLTRHIAADGVHLPERDMERAKAIRADNPNWIITCALHGPLGHRSHAGIDAFVVSPVFRAGGASASKADLGIYEAARLIASLPRPAYALGGIKPDNVEQLLETQACGIAGIEAISKAFLS